MSKYQVGEHGELFKKFTIRIVNPYASFEEDTYHYLNGKKIMVSITNTIANTDCEFIIDGRSFLGQRPDRGSIIILQELNNPLNKIHCEVF